ncbi:MAG TPA: hypothetical protein VND65_01775 [Candidatus Binatia bacterium]|nr:hypothetical protein [Candidatus Binatia bacterium]
MASWLESFAAVATVIGAIAIAIFGFGSKVRGLQAQTDENTRDINGQGRKFGKELTYKIRELAAECEDAKLKEKLLALANLTEPK